MPISAQEFEQQLQEAAAQRESLSQAGFSGLDDPLFQIRSATAREEQPIISGASSLEKFLDVINTPQQFLFGLLNKRPNEAFGEAGVRGTRENLRFKDVLERNRLASGPAATALGFAGDILFDPALLVAGPAFRLAGKGIGLTTRIGIGAGKRILGPTISDKLFQSAIKPIARRFSKTAFASPVERDLLNLIDFEIGKAQNARRAILLEEGAAREIALEVGAKAGLSAEEILPEIARRIEVKTGSQLAFPFASLEESRKVVKNPQLPLFVSGTVEAEFSKIDDVLKLAAKEEKLANIPAELNREIAQQATSAKARLENIIAKERQFGVQTERLEDATVDYLTHLTTPEAKQLIAKLPNFRAFGRRFSGRHAFQLQRILKDSHPAIQKVLAEGGVADIKTLNRLWREGKIFPQLGPQGSSLFVDDPFAAAAVRRIRGEKAIADAQVILKAAGNPKMAAPKGIAPGHFRQLRLPDDPRLAALRNVTGKVRFDPDVAEHLEQVLEKTLLPEGLDVFLKTFDTVQGIWKGLTLAPFPAYHVRNAAGNMWNNYLAGMGAGSVRFYKDALAFQRGRLPNVTFGGKSYTTQELTQLVEDYGVVRRGFFSGEVTRKSIKQLQGVSFTAEDIPGLGKLVSGGFKAGTAIEDNARIAHFFFQLEKGKEPLDAALSVKKYLFDYVSGLTDFEQSVMRRIMPFYAWSRFNIPLQAQAVVQNPTPFVRLSEIVNTVRQKGLPIGSLEGFEERTAKLRGEDRELLPDFIREAVGIPIRLSPDGDPEYFLLGGWLPAADLEVIGRPGGIADRLKDLLSPFIKEPIEQAFNFDTFLNRKIEDFPGQKAKFLTVPLRRRLVKSLRNIRLLGDADRLLRAVQREPEGFTPEQVSKIGTITRFIFGLKSFEVSPERGARRLLFQRRENVRRLRSAARRGDEENVRTLREIIERNR